MDFDNPKVYGDTFISDGLVYDGFSKVIISYVFDATKLDSRKERQQSDCMQTNVS